MSQFPPATFHPQQRPGAPGETCREEETERVTILAREALLKGFSHIPCKYYATHFPVVLFTLFFMMKHKVTLLTRKNKN